MNNKRRIATPWIGCAVRFWLGICRTSLAVSALRIMRYCPKKASVGNSLDRSETLFRIPLRQYRIILSADTASEVRQMLSQKRR